MSDTGNSSNFWRNKRALLSPPIYYGSGWYAFQILYDDKYFATVTELLVSNDTKDAIQSIDRRLMTEEGYPLDAFALATKSYAYKEHERLLRELRRDFAEVKVFLKRSSFNQAFEALGFMEMNGMPLV